MLTLTGIIVGLVIRYSPGHAGPDPASEPLIGEAVSFTPSRASARAHSWPGGRRKPGAGASYYVGQYRIGRHAGRTVFPARQLARLDDSLYAGTIGALFGTPVAAALIFSQTLSGAITTRRCGIVSSHRFWLRQPVRSPPDCSSTRSFRYLLSISQEMRIGDIFSGTIVTVFAIAVGMVAVWCLPHLHALMHRLKSPVIILGIGGFILADTIFDTVLRSQYQHRQRRLASTQAAQHINTG